MAAVQAALKGSDLDVGGLSGPHRRLVDAWTSPSAGRAGPADLAALLNQVLRHEWLSTGAVAKLDLPVKAAGPSRQHLDLAGLEVLSLGSDQLRVSSGSRWAPGWLHGDPSWIDLAISSPEGMLKDGMRVPSLSRPERTDELDPAVASVSTATTYRSRAQAVALRTVALSEPGSTVHVVLPTGSGKSLVGLIPGLLQPAATTVVVVPTVALALDQERQAHGRFPAVGLPDELAYYGSLDRERQLLIRRRLADGEQRLVFTSPESLVASLAPSLHQLARRGGLRYIVVDEAHLVRSWGLDFRPEFQLAAALISELKQVAKAAGQQPLTTVLMTATLSLEGLRLNETLFKGEPSLFVGSSFLRTELRYLLAPCASEGERLERLTQAIYRLPRPAIVYTTRKAAAAEIVAHMQGAGFGRVAAFHGDTASTDRLQILRGWSGTDGPTSIDVVVGTSAFGLGVDQPDVRTVVHACVPGSVDRYYQEVGRAGRDGHAAVAVWLPVKGPDLAEASRIEGATVIGDDKAWARWRAMRSSDARIGDQPKGSLVFDTSAVPEHTAAGSDANRLWNRVTLTLLAQAGVIEINPLPPPAIKRDLEEPEADWVPRRDAAWRRFRDAVAVRSARDVGNFDRGVLEDAIARVRSDVLNTQRDSLTHVRDLLEEERCWADVFAEEYSFRYGSGAATAVQRVSASCSGCPARGHHGPALGRAPMPVIPLPSMPLLKISLRRPLMNELHGQGGLVVTYEETGRRLGPVPWLEDLIRRCVANGIRALFVPTTLRTHPAVQQAHRHAAEGFVMIDGKVNGPRPFAVPALIVLTPGELVDPGWLPPIAHGPPRIVLMPADTLDPERPTVRVADWRSPVLAVDDLLRRI
ncbi:protein DpdF [Micromonospora chersina]|uniref:protein DpdF n=1 Tax=Micromonospora chersina TaxID=47854 RepID=UPI0037228364